MHNASAWPPDCEITRASNFEADNTEEKNLMRAYLVHQPGGPEALELQEVPDPSQRDGWVLIDVRAIGLNRAEAILRSGGFGDSVNFPRITGIECVGVVAHGGGTDLQPGETVAAVMGGMGIAFDGSYAEQVLMPRSNVLPQTTDLGWAELGAIPETFLTGFGCLEMVDALDVPARVLIRPGASALGLAVAQIVAELGGETVGVTRSSSKRDALLAGGMTEVLVADGPVAADVASIWPDGPTAVIDAVASNASLSDDLAMLGDTRRLCIAGALADNYGTASTDDTASILDRPNVSFYSSDSIHSDTDTAKLQAIVDKVAQRSYRVNIAEIVDFGGIVDAHHKMEANAYAGKVVAIL